MYLIIDECPDYPKTDVDKGARQGKRYAVRHSNQGLSYERTKIEIEKLYPNAQIYNPLESAPKGSLILFVYLSPRKDGVGRQICNFELWAIKRG